MKLVIGTKQGKCLQKELSDEEAKVFWGKKIGATLSGEELGFAGYEFELTGGSDSSGFPMRKDVDGIHRKKILAVEGIGLKKKAKGIRQRKTVCGNTIHPKIAQVNVRVLKAGAEPLFEEKKEEAPETPAQAPAQAPAETVQEAQKSEEKSQEVSEEKPEAAPEDKPEGKTDDKIEEKPAEKATEKQEHPAENAPQKPAEEKPKEASEEAKKEEAKKEETSEAPENE